MRLYRPSARRGTIILLTALALIGILAFIALAFDMGLLMLARNQSQMAADCAAMAGARTLTGDTYTNNNYSNALPNAKVAASANSILGKVIEADSQLSLSVGDYYYDSSSSSFKISSNSKIGSDNWTLAQATINSQRPSYFAKVLGFSSLSTSAMATAAHRPRDTVIVVDFSGSMRFESMLGAPHGGARTNPMNPDTIYPTFGHYNGNSSKLIYAGDVTVSSGEQIGKANVSTTTASAPDTVISGFYGDTTPFGTSTPAFTAAPSTYASTPGGDVPLKANKGSGASYAKNVSEFVFNNSTTTSRDWRWELDGYAAYSGGGNNATTAAATDYAGTTFNGYTQGPGYWGKTFFTWPPDPRVPLNTTSVPGTSSSVYTATQIQNLVAQFQRDFGYTAADFNNTAVTTESAIVSTTSTTILVPASPNNNPNFPTTSLPMKVLVGHVSSGMYTTTPSGTSPEVVTVTSIGATSGGLTTWNITRAQDSTTAVANFTTTPSASFTTAATSFTVASVTGFPTTAGFKIMVGTTSGGVFTATPEVMTVTAINTSTKTLTVTRGVYGTTKVAGTTSMSVALVSTVGLLTGPPIYGTFTAANTTVNSTSTGTPAVVGIGKTPSTASLWTSWANASTLGTYLTSSVYQPASAIVTPPIRKLQSSDAIYLQTMRLYSRVTGTGLPKNGSGVVVPADWRMRFFKTPSGGPLTDMSLLYSSGTMRTPSSTTYLINYDAILDWIKNSGPNPFPNQLRAGGILYYSSIPSTINVSSLYPTDPNQRIWKEYIDEVLGFQQTSGSGSSPVYSDVSSLNGYGADYAWTASSSSALPTGWPANAPSAYSATAPTSFGYTDNPMRGRLRMWFGPLSFVDFIGNYNASDVNNNNSSRLWWPGTVREAPTYQTKLAIQAAIKDTIRNHPNDLVSLIFFSSPKSSANAAGYYNYARAPMGRDQRSMINALWFSPKVNSTNSEISIYNSAGASTKDIYDVPRANGGTCYNMPLMLAYNQFSSNQTLVNYTANAQPGTAGGLGRVGASKLLVFETDGMVNTGASASLTSSSNGTGYYQVRIGDANNFSAAGSEFPSSVSGVTFSTGATQSQAIASQICANLSSGGFSTTRKPVLIHCIAFGSLFEPSNSSTSKTNALSNLAALEVIGKVQSSGATTLASNKIIVGDFNTRIANMQAAMSSIMQDGVSVTLISSGTGKP